MTSKFFKIERIFAIVTIAIFTFSRFYFIESLYYLTYLTWAVTLGLLSTDNYFRYKATRNKTSLYFFVGGAVISIICFVNWIIYMLS